MESGKEEGVPALLVLDLEARLEVAEDTYRQLYSHAKRAVRRLGHNDSLNATALINEAWLKLAKGDQRWDSREHFVATMSRVMRHLLVDHARAKGTAKHGADAMRVTLTGLDDGGSSQGTALDLLAVDNALTKLRALDPRLGLIAELRFFGGLTVEAAAAALNLSEATVKRDSRAAKAFLAMELDY